MKRLLILFFVFVLFASYNATSNDDIEINMNAYVDTYIATDNDHSHDNGSESYYLDRKFSYINGQKNNFSINTAQIGADFNYQNFIRGVVTFHYGDLANQAFYMPGSGKILQEAYIGIQVIDDLWVDAGYFLTHIGGESLLPKDNWLSSHSMVTYVEPFFHSGVKATYDNGTFSAGLHLLNSGYSYIENNDNKTFGYNAGYSAGDIFSISIAGMIGNEEDGPPYNAKTNLYNNICIESHPDEKLGLKAQLDIASLEDAYSDNGELEAATYMGFSVQGRYQLLEKFAAAARFAYFDDTKGYAEINASGMGITAGVEYQPTKFSYIRLEGRMLNFDDSEDSDGNKFLDAEGDQTNSRMEVMINFGVFID